MTLRRRHPDVDDPAFERFADDVRATVSTPPGEETARRHLAAMRVAAEESQLDPVSGAAPDERHRADRVGRRRSAGPVRPLFRLGAVTASALAAFAGAGTALAAVGVELPEPVRAPFEAVGIELPNQPSDDDERTAPAGEDGQTEPGAPGADERETRGSETGRERSGDRGEHGRDRAGERRRGDGKARGRNGTQPGKDGTRGNSENHRRDDTAPNRSNPGDRPANQRGGRDGSGSRGAAPSRRPARAKRAKPERARPTGPRQRVRPTPPVEAKPAPQSEPAPDTDTDVSPDPTSTSP
jgi:hypothetical protein